MTYLKVWSHNTPGVVVSVFETFSKRMKKRERAGKPDVYQYEKLPPQLLVQVIHIWVDAIGPYYSRGEFEFSGGRANNNGAWIHIFQTLCRELGVFRLGGEHHNPFVQCQEFLQKTSVEYALDLIELSFKYIDVEIRGTNRWELQNLGIKQTPDSAIEELNYRFREHGVGYQFESGEIFRVDSQFVHEEIIKPALALLHSEGLSGPEEEFLKAHEHYRHRRRKEALSEALKSLESTLKAVCERKKWPYAKNATSKSLVEIVFKEHLLPTELQAHFAALRSTLESGIPAIRNSSAGHGQGAVPVEVPDYVVAYGIHLTGAAIVFLVEALKASR